MKFIESFHEGENIRDIYLCKQRTSAMTKFGKSYESVVLQDKTGQMDGKIWEPYSPGIEEFDALDYVEVSGKVNVYNGALQLNIERVRKCREGEYLESNYFPMSSRDIEEMYKELLGYIDKIKNEQIKHLLRLFFVEDTEFITAFKKSSAAKSVHHGFIGGLLEHTLGVTRNAAFFADSYKHLKKDTLVAAALFHDMGKIREFSLFPQNDYTDDGQLIGHMVMGIEMLNEKLVNIPDFDPMIASELKHLILSHHGEYEYGAPKKPATAEALALHFADNIDAKMETIKEFLDSQDPSKTWTSYNKFLDTAVKRSTEV